VTTRLSRRKKLAFALITVAGTVTLLLGAVLVVDLYLHRKAERSAGLNVWGYRGPLRWSKRAGETRVVMIGGSTVFGYGVLWHEAIPAVLEQELTKRLPLGTTTAVSVVNLGMNNEGAYSFPFTLRDFDFLDYDVIVFYEGYNDVTGTNRSVFRHTSPVFRLVGYYPILPLVLDEKLLLWTYGDLDTAYRARAGEKVVFTPSASRRVAATALDVTENITDVMSRQIERLAGPKQMSAELASSECPAPWAVYCGSIAQSISEALARGRRTLIVTQPYYSDDHRAQQQALRAMLHARFGDRREVHYADLGNLIDLKDPAVSYDRMHLNADGNARVARALADPVAELIRR
jgi:hypothetical protein